jgi:hypothetical protein
LREATHDPVDDTAGPMGGSYGEFISKSRTGDSKKDVKQPA